MGPHTCGTPLLAEKSQAMRYAIALIALVLAGCPSKVLAPGQIKGSMWDVDPNKREP